MNSEPRTLELSISRANLEAALIASGQMQAFGVLNDDDDLLDLRLEMPDVIPMKVKLMKEQEVEVIKHNG